MMLRNDEDNNAPVISVNGDQIAKNPVFPYKQLFMQPDDLFNLELSYFKSKYAFSSCFIRCYFDDYLDEEVFCAIDDNSLFFSSMYNAFLISLEDKKAYLLNVLSKNEDYCEVEINTLQEHTLQDIWSKLTIFYIWLFFEINAQAFKTYNRYEKCKRYMKRIHDTAEPLPQKTIRLQKSIEVFFNDNKTDKLRDYKRRCEAWQVRGHYRHYKNGKVVFVKSYTKGQGRLKQTNYSIGGITE